MTINKNYKYKKRINEKSHQYSVIGWLRKDKEFLSTTWMVMVKEDLSDGTREK
jgi:hypothetical protein